MTCFGALGHIFGHIFGHHVLGVLQEVSRVSVAAITELVDESAVGVLTIKTSAFDQKDWRSFPIITGKPFIMDNSG